MPSGPPLVNVTFGGHITVSRSLGHIWMSVVYQVSV
jgi:hypothetical protein